MNLKTNIRQQKILMVMVLCFAFTFTATIAFAALTFDSNSITANVTTTIDAGAGNTLLLQTANNGPITTGTGTFSTTKISLGSGASDTCLERSATGVAEVTNCAGSPAARDLVVRNITVSGTCSGCGSGGGGAGNPGGTNGQIQFNNAGVFGGSTMTTEGQNLIFAPSADRFLQWRPTNYLTQNGSWGCRGQEQANPFDPTRRDDAVKCGWNLDGEVPGMNSTSLSFESYYVTSVGIRQSETYFNVSDGLGHGHRPWAVYYDIDFNTSTTVFGGDVFYFGNKEGTGPGYAAISASGISTPGWELAVAGDDSELKTVGATAAVDMVLRPQGNGNISLQTSAVNLSAPLITDGSRFMKSGSYKGNTTIFATSTALAVTAGHVASWDASGNLIDGGTGASGCTVSGGVGALQMDNGAGGCTGSDNAKLVNSSDYASLQLNSPGGASQVIMQIAGFDSVRLISQVGSTNPRLAMAFDGNGLDVALQRSGVGAFEINNGTPGAISTTKLTVGAITAAFHNSSASSVLTITGNTITPTGSVHHVGAGLIKTITVPSNCTPTCSIDIIPNATFTYDATGNIVVPAGGGTAVINKTMRFTWDGTKWAPSY